MSLIFIISKNVSISAHNLTVPEASGDPYWDRILETIELKTCAANLTFTAEYGVSFPHVLVNLPLHEFHKQFRSIFKRLGTSVIKYMNRFSGLNKLTVR